MDIVISPLERAVCDAIALLTRTRFHKGAPFYLRKPQHPLRVTVTHKTRSDGDTTVGVECDTWGDGTWVTLTLSPHNRNWIAWGPFGIHYGPVYPVASLTTRDIDTNDILPMFVHRPDAVRHQELRIRQRVRPGR